MEKQRCARGLTSSDPKPLLPCLSQCVVMWFEGFPGAPASPFAPIQPLPYHACASSGGQRTTTTPQRRTGASGRSHCCIAQPTGNAGAKNRGQNALFAFPNSVSECVLRSGLL